ncbi:MAG: hypothetical protein ACK56I_03790, partial [bacterium]
VVRLEPGALLGMHLLQRSAQQGERRVLGDDMRPELPALVAWLAHAVSRGLRLGDEGELVGELAAHPAVPSTAVGERVGGDPQHPRLEPARAAAAQPRMHGPQQRLLH